MSNNYNKLYNLIESLKDKISKLDNKKNKVHYIKKNNIKCINNNENSFLTYKISCPPNYENNCNKTKKYIGLLFNSNLDDTTDYDHDHNYSNTQFSFIKLKKSVCIINYSIQIDIISHQVIKNNCSISIGIKEKNNSKIKIIKGGKANLDLSNHKSSIILNNTILYNAEDGDELCLIADINNKIKINSNKSLIKICLLT
jgi:hypothetical protein